MVVCSRGKHPERKRFPGESILPFMTWAWKPCSIISTSSHLSRPLQGPPRAQRESIHIDFVMGSASIRKTTQDQKYCCGHFWKYSLPQTHIFSVYAKSLQSCLTLCDPRDCSPTVFSVHGILQARILCGLPFPSPGDIPNPGIEPTSLMSPALAGRFFTLVLRGKCACTLSLKWYITNS